MSKLFADMTSRIIRSFDAPTSKEANASGQTKLVYQKKETNQKKDSSLGILRWISRLFSKRSMDKESAAKTVSAATEPSLAKYVADKKQGLSPNAPNGFAHSLGMAGVRLEYHLPP